MHDGIKNTATGYVAMYLNTSGDHNTATGNYALYSNNGDHNTAVGSFALSNNVAGSSNTAIGYKVGES